MFKTMVVSFDDANMEPGALRVTDCQEIVRCADCEYFIHIKNDEGLALSLCHKLGVSNANVGINPYGYCAWGEQVKEC